MSLQVSRPDRCTCLQSGMNMDLHYALTKILQPTLFIMPFVFKNPVFLGMGSIVWKAKKSDSIIFIIGR